MTRPIISQKNFENRIRQPELKVGDIDLEGSSLDPSAKCFDKKAYYGYMEVDDYLGIHGWYRDEDEESEDDDDDWEITNYGIDPELGGCYGIDFTDEVGFRD